MIEGATEQRVSVRVGKGAPQEIARQDDEAVDVFETPGIDRDTRRFLYRPKDGRFHEIAQPAPEPVYANPIKVDLPFPQRPESATSNSSG